MSEMPTTVRELGTWLVPQIWRKVTKAEALAYVTFTDGPEPSTPDLSDPFAMAGPTVYRALFEVCEAKGPDEASAVRAFLDRFAEVFPGDGKFLMRRALYHDTSANYATSGVDHVISFRAVRVPKEYTEAPWRSVPP